MKQLSTLVKNVEKFNYQDFEKLITYDIAKEYFATTVNEENFKEQFSDKQIFSMLVFKELKSSLDTFKKDKRVYELVLDCNYAKSKMHDNCKFLVDYYSLLDSQDNRAIQFYVTCNVTKKEVYFRLCTSCKKVTREQFKSLEDSLKFTVRYDKKTNRAKTSERKKVQYNEIVNVVKNVLAVLNNEIEIQQDEQIAQ